MQRLSYIALIFFGLLAFHGMAQSPHGNDLTIDCKACHVATSWKYLTNFGKKNKKSKFLALRVKYSQFDRRILTTIPQLFHLQVVTSRPIAEIVMVR